MLATYHDATFDEIISILKEKAVPNPFCHVELNTTDLKKAKDFYGKLFDWKLEDIPGEVLYFINKPVLKEVMAAVERVSRV